MSEESGGSWPTLAHSYVNLVQNGCVRGQGSTWGLEFPTQALRTRQFRAGWRAAAGVCRPHGPGLARAGRLTLSESPELGPAAVGGWGSHLILATPDHRAREFWPQLHQAPTLPAASQGWTLPEDLGLLKGKRDPQVSRDSRHLYNQQTRTHS